MTKKESLDSCQQTLEKIQKNSPLVHSITNSVVTNITANILLAVGASPLMAHAVEELEEIINISGSLVINIGTLDTFQIKSMEKAMKYALTAKKACVLDPVGAGASKLRTETALNLITLGKPAVIRGNSSEILALANAEKSSSKGVDATDSVQSAENSANFLAEKYNSVISVSGEFDYITDGKRVSKVYAEEKLPLQLSTISKITGMGCSCTALTGACLAVESDAFIAATTAMAIMKTVQVEACKKAKGPGSLEMHILDSLYSIKKEDIAPYMFF